MANAYEPFVSFMLDKLMKEKAEYGMFGSEWRDFIVLFMLSISNNIMKNNRKAHGMTYCFCNA